MPLAYGAIKVIMVDVDGVLITHPHPLGWSHNLTQDLGLSREALQECFFEPHFADVVRGRSTLRERLAPVLREIAPQLNCDRLIEYWFANDSQLNLDLLTQMDAARRSGIKLHLATVQEHERAQFLWRGLGLEKRFDAIHYSADLGSAKPEEEFFIEIERRSGFLPTEILLVDDKIENVEAARRCQWYAAQWTGRESLQELIRYVLPSHTDPDSKSAKF